MVSEWGSDAKIYDGGGVVSGGVSCICSKQWQCKDRRKTSIGEGMLVDSDSGGLL